jgi:hypothetical protein
MDDIQFHPMLDSQACQDWSQQVIEAQAHWTHRHPSVPFYTLGMAAYLDSAKAAAPSSATYQQRILRNHSNALLLARFTPLYQQLCHTFATLYGVQTHLIADQAAVPGFHIHLPHPVFANDVASIHRDLQFQQVFPHESLAPHQVLTFTLPISLPPGSGLNLWRNSDKSFHPYHTGQLVIHSGLQTHQAVLSCTGSVPPRIALQGHAVLREKSIELYW